MTPDGLERLKFHEGLRLKPYDDATGRELYLRGKLTVGYGRNLTDVGITHHEATILLTHDIERATAECRRAFDWLDLLDAVRQDVIIQLAFNMGLAGLKTFKKFLAACERQDWPLAIHELMDSRWATQVQPDRVNDLVVALDLGVWD